MYEEFNENPQIILLKDEIKRLKDKVEWYDNELGKMIYGMRKQHEARQMELDLYERWKKGFDADRIRMKEEMKNFNALPWHKKMRYMFNVE